MGGASISSVTPVFSSTALSIGLSSKTISALTRFKTEMVIGEVSISDAAASSSAEASGVVSAGVSSLEAAWELSVFSLTGAFSPGEEADAQAISMDTESNNDIMRFFMLHPLFLFLCRFYYHCTLNGRMIRG